MEDVQKLFLFFIVPGGKEESYAERTKSEYSKGSVDVRLEYNSKHEIVEAPALQ